MRTLDELDGMQHDEWGEVRIEPEELQSLIRTVRAALAIYSMPDEEFERDDFPAVFEKMRAEIDDALAPWRE